MSHWPDIPYDRWKTCGHAIHMWAQIIGKYRLALSPWVNHSWHATLYVNGRGLTTGLIPYKDSDFEILIDCIDHCLRIHCINGQQETFDISNITVAEFDATLKEKLKNLKIDVTAHGTPNEVADPVPFVEQTDPVNYNPDAVHDFWQALLNINRVFNYFRTGFMGKVSPAHLFWGSFDFAITRFSGRTAPPHPGGIPALPDTITREAYSHEVSSAGFWPGANGIDYPAFYAYAYPTPEGFSKHAVLSKEAFFHEDLGEFILPYDAVRQSADPDQTLLDFLQSTYEAAADLGSWDRKALDRPFAGPKEIPNI
ncbi:MAG: DUF5996 family protein [Pseudomonadota bacterium]